MSPPRIITLRVSTLLFCLILPLFITHCSIKLISDYDDATYQEVLKVAKKVDLFYGNLLEKPENDRPYADFSQQYVEIEADLRSLVARNEVRPLNRESTEISEDILSLWEKYKQRHKEKNKYDNGPARLDRNRLAREFNNLAKAELAKKLGAVNGSAKQNSK